MNLYLPLCNKRYTITVDGFFKDKAYCRSKSYKDGKYFKIYRLTENLGPDIVRAMPEKIS